MKNDAWEIVPRPSDKSIVTSKWIYDIKHLVDGNIDKYKARFVTRGFSQKEGIDYEETFAPIARYTTIRSLVSLAAIMGWNIHQMDVKTTFPNETIDEEVYIEQTQGFEINHRETHVCRLKKALYGLKQAPRACYARMDAYLLRLGFTGSSAYPNLYIRVVQGEPVIILFQFQMELKHDHWIAAKHIPRYLRGTLHHCLWYTGNEIQLTGYKDLDWGGNEIDGRGTTGGCFNLGSSMVSWMRRKQDIVSLSSGKIEYVVASEICGEAI
eukprot:PITA_27409